MADFLLADGLSFADEYQALPGSSYREVFLETVDEGWTFLCNLCGRSVQETPCPDHAPMAVPGLKLVECAAEPPHLMWVHDRDDYGTPCFWCMSAERAEAYRLARQCRHWAWRRWRITRALVSWAYALGVISGSSTSWGDGHNWCQTVYWRGRRPYLLGRERRSWR